MAEAQAELRAIAFEMVRLEERCQEVSDTLPWPDNEAVMFVGEIAWDLPTALLTTVECMLEDLLRPAVESLERAARVSEGELRGESNQATADGHHPSLTS